MADPTKPPDRLRPFKRINNDRAIPAVPPDGLGTACGCHLPDDLPDLDAQFREFLKNRPDALGKVFQAIEVAKQVARTAQQVTDIVRTLQALAAAVPVALLGPLGATGIGTVIAALAAVGNTLNVVSSFVNGLLDAVDTGLRKFMERIGAALARRAIRRVPQWVPVEDAGQRDRITAAQIREVEGIVARSYCDPVGTPFFQWQQWLSWSIQVRPEPAYTNLRVDGFSFATDGIQGRPLVDPATVELQWDMGALNVGGDGPGVYQNALQGKKTEEELTAREAPFFQSTRVFADSENHWLWPTAGMYVWASGRWVYDCSRPDSVAAGATPRMYTMLNPVRALATASWEAWGFKENTAPKSRAIRNAVPAIRFMFIASTHGGHLSQPSLAEEDYEFILDLPPMPPLPAPFPVGHTLAHQRGDDELPDFPHNTVMLRPRLLRDLRKPAGNVKKVTPVIELLPSDKGPGIVEQVKVTVPAKQLSGTGAGHAGFLLSLGWHDPNVVRAKTAKSAAVNIGGMRGRLEQDRDTPVDTLRNLFKPELDALKKDINDKLNQIKLPIIPGNPTSIDDLINNHLPESPINLRKMVSDVGVKVKALAQTLVDKIFDGLLDALAGGVGAVSTEECMFHFGVNGRWTSRYLDLQRNVRQAFTSPVEVEVVLGPDDAAYYASSGVEWNPVGNIMFASHDDRLLKRGGEAVQWPDIALASGDALRDLVFEYVLQILKGAPGQPLALGIENDPIGVKQPAALDPPNGTNPIGMQKSQPGDVPVDPAAATFAHAQGQQSVLAVEVAGKRDYVLDGAVHIAAQFPK